MLKSYPNQAIAKPGFLFLQGIFFFFISTLGLPGCQSQPKEPIAQESATTNSDGTGIVTGDTSDMKIALSMSFVEGSSFRQAQVESFETAATTAQEQGLLSDFTVLDAGGNTEKQTEQIQELIDEKYDAILINPNSVSDLNEVVKSACNAGIIMIDFDNEVTEPCTYTINTIWNHYGAVQGNYIGRRLTTAQILEIRGAKGATADTDISAAIHASLAQFPGLQVVDAVHGNWTQETAHEAVTQILPSLPKIDAVVTQGGDGYGTALAFAQSDRPMPIIMMGNRYDELKWWQEQREATGYKTISASATPGISAVALWTAQQIFAGKEVPKFLEIPILVIEEENLDVWLSVTPEGGVANADYTLEWTLKLIEAHINDTPIPPPPVPNPS